MAVLAQAQPGNDSLIQTKTMTTRFSVCLLTAALLAQVQHEVCADQEQDLIAILRSEASPTQKSDACRRLRLVGTVQAVPPLAAMLDNDHVAHAATFALEGMPFPEAGAALREALGRASGPTKAGLIISLGSRRDVESLPVLVPLLKSSDPAVVSAVATSLGRIGTKEAVAALGSALGEVAPTIRPTVADALLECAERLTTGGNTPAAMVIYQKLFATNDRKEVRAAAYAGMIRAERDRALTLVVKAMSGNDPAAQEAALQLAGEIEDDRATQTFIAVLPRIVAPLQVGLLRALRQRGDVAAVPAALAMARDGNVEVRAAAIAALGALGDASAVSILASAATSKDEPERQAAREALVELQHGDVSTALVRHLAISSAEVQTEIVRAIVARADDRVIQELLQVAGSDTPDTRMLALKALNSLVDERHWEALVQLLAAAKDATAREDIRRVLESLAGRSNSARRPDLAPIVQTLATGDTETRIALLKVSSLLADTRIRTALRASRKDPDPRIRAAADRSLCATRDPEMLPDLLELARNTQDTELSSLALSGYVNLTADEDIDLPTEKRADLIARVFDLAKRPEQKRLLLSAIAVMPHPTTLAIAERSGADSALKVEAEIACLKIASTLAPSDYSPAELCLARLAETATTLSVRTNARATLKRLKSDWLRAGPYRQNGKQCQELFDVEFAPEKREQGRIDWRRAPGSADLTREGEVDLSSIVGGDHCVVYLKTRVHVDTPRQVLFSIGTDDGMKLWLNGELVHANNAVRGLTPGQDRATGLLKQGWNDLLAKITQHTLGCGMILHITAHDGSALSDLRFDTHGGSQQ